MPYLLPLPGHPHAYCVHGELYSVSDEDAVILDRFEGIPIGFYVRRKVNVIVTVEEDGRQKEPDPVTGKIIATGSVVNLGTYFRSKGGPLWAQKWSVEKLQTLPMTGRYTLKDAEDYVPQSRRTVESESSDSR